MDDTRGYFVYSSSSTKILRHQIDFRAGGIYIRGAVGICSNQTWPTVHVVRIIEQCSFNSAPDTFNGQTAYFILKPPKVIESRTYVKEANLECYETTLLCYSRHVQQVKSGSNQLLKKSGFYSDVVLEEFALNSWKNTRQIHSFFD